MHHHTDLAWLAAECHKTDSLAELAAIALAELKKFPYGAEIVCGPITTGGRGSVENNLNVFNAVIEGLREAGFSIFSQMPYEDKIFSLRERWQAEDPRRVGKYYSSILTDFYQPLIESSLINIGWFIPCWESSRGARWERKEFEKRGIKICDITDAWIDSVLRPVR